MEVVEEKKDEEGNLIPEEELTVNPPEVDFDALKAINDDVVGWLELEAIPSISYPIAQGEDNEYYLHRTIKKTYNFAGSVFIDSTNASDFSDCNTIIYGHNMKNGSMFGKLKQMYESEKYKDSKYLWICTPNGKYRYEIFRCRKNYSIYEKIPFNYNNYDNVWPGRKSYRYSSSDLPKVCIKSFCWYEHS